ncbi:MAG: DUF1573 domain-containing protein [Thermoguttaceae bacterium]|jgi:hypothetical protein
MSRWPVRISLLLVLPVLVGVALGVGTAQYRFAHPPWRGMWRQEPVHAAGGTASSSEARPKAVVDAEKFDFGTIESGEEGSHAFVFRNDGTAPLTLEAGGTSCHCTVSTIEKGTLEPGESAKVKVAWKPREMPGEFRQTANIKTNDPRKSQIALAITGHVVTNVHSEPAELIFSTLACDQSAQGEVRLWCCLPKPKLEIRDFKLADPATSGYFSVTYRSIPPEQIDRQSQARSGVLLEVAVKPGLPQGPFQQTILMATNLESTPAIEVPIKGTIVADISVVGEQCTGDPTVVTFGTISSQTGAQRRLLLIARGPHRTELKFKPIQISPELLQVSIGHMTSVGTNAATQTPLVIQIPKGSRPVNHLGSVQGKLGKIILQTNHPKYPQLPIFVRFAVEG